LGKAYFRKGETAEAIRYLKEGVEGEPETASLHYQLGQAYLKMGQHEEAEKEMAVAQKLQATTREKQAEVLAGKLPLPPPAPESK